MSGEQEGHKKTCWKCKTAIIYVRISPDKLQWQNEADHKVHYTYISDKNYKCNLPGAVEPTPEKPEEKKTIKVQGPFDEAEIIARWASEKAYKMVMAEVTDINNLSVQKQNSLGQKEGMLTRLLADTVLELMKQHGIKTDYTGDK